MRVTRSWLNEFVSLADISNEKLYETLNAIGLEVGSLKQIELPSGVLVGKILACEKHPDADKLNVCTIDVGSGGARQIVCGAANVVNAEYVAVATIGAVLPNGLEIKPATLRGVESEGMVCSSTELGLPQMGEGIMMLDTSIGKLEVGRELNTYKRLADTLVELELTANRGDCLSVHGVARDLSVALELDMKPFEYKKKEKVLLGIAREAEIRVQGEMDADLHYKLTTAEHISTSLLVELRLAMVEARSNDRLANLLAYATHTTGVILRAYDGAVFRNENHKIVVRPTSKTKGVVEIVGNNEVLSVVGVSQKKETLADETSKELLLEASYIHPHTVVEAVADASLQTDDLYYKVSRGSNPDLVFGLSVLASLLNTLSDIACHEGSLTVEVAREHETVVVNAKEISSIIGMQIEIGKIVTILQKMGCSLSAVGQDVVAARIPAFRHDIKHIQDIAEEIVRIIGINNITAKPFVFTEKPRLNDTTEHYRFKKVLKNRAVGVSFYENVSYVFTQREMLECYGFPVVKAELDLVNPIVEELNTLRSTILINLLSAAKRNVSYTKKSIPLFEIGAVFGSKREQKEVITLLFSGQLEKESLKNAGKPKMIDFATFAQKLSAVIGTFDLLPCTHHNGLIHPYQSADIAVNNKVCGFVSKLHPSAQESFDLPVTFIAEVDFEACLPKHINAKPISNFQGVYKDLSVVINKDLGYHEVAKVLNGLALPTLKECFPIDIYGDEKLGERKSLTIRCFIQSMDKTLEEGDIEFVMSSIMSSLQKECNAALR